MKKMKFKKIKSKFRSILNSAIRSMDNFKGFWKALKTTKAALISTGLILFIVLVIVALPFMLKVKIPESLIGLASLFSATATVVICFYTVRSVIEVIKANKENFRVNQQRDIKDSFEKKFSLLLQEHNNYLTKLIQSENRLYSVDYIQKISGHESYSIIRGVAKFIMINGSKFCLHDGVLSVRIDIYRDEKSGLAYYLPSSEFIEANNLLKEKRSYEVYSSGSISFFHWPSNGRVIASDSYMSYLNDKNTSTEIKRRLSSYGDEALEYIVKSNDISKNILSPYMRIIYHLLKLSSENTSTQKEMKKHTNLVRSIIPYDILMLIAINAMYFYKSFDESRNELARWSDIFQESEDGSYREVFNDYHKYYKLLVKCHFFEHLNMEFPLVKNKIKNIELNVDMSFMHPMLFNSGLMIHSTGRNKEFLVISGDTESTCKRLYKTFHNEIMSIETEVLVLLFYFEDNSIDIAKFKIMDKLISLNKNMNCTGKMKSAHFNIAYANNSFIYPKQCKTIISRDFLDLYIKGNLPSIF